MSKAFYETLGMGSTDAATLASADATEKARKDRALADKRAFENRLAADKKRATSRAVSKAKQGETKPEGALGVVAALGLLGGGFYFWQSSVHEAVTLTPIRANWTYALEREEFRTFDKTMLARLGSARKPPKAAYDITSEQIVYRLDPIYETETIAKTCSRQESETLADGSTIRRPVAYDCSFERKVKVGETEVYRIQHTYKIDQWEKIDALTGEGTRGTYVLPEFAPAAHCATEPTVGCQRAKGDAEIVHKVVFNYWRAGDPKKQVTARELPVDDWKAMTMQQPYSGIVNGLGAVLAIDGVDADYDAMLAKLAE